MKVFGSSLIAALANRRSTLINGAVGFSTFAVGDALSQGARPQSQLVVAGWRRQHQSEESSWQQQFIDRTRGVDYARSAKVGLLGIMLNGFALGAWYRVLDRYIGSDRTRFQQILKKLVVDQMVYAPFSITSFVGYAAVLNGGGPAKVVDETKKNLGETFWSIWLTDWKVWPAANLFMFRFIPSSYRPSFASMVQVAWQAYLSSVSYDSPHHYHHHHHHQKTPVATIQAGVAIEADGGSSGAVLVRGGEAGKDLAGKAAAAVAAVAKTGGEDESVPSPGVPVGSNAIAGAGTPRVAVDRRATGRYAYTSSVSSFTNTLGSHACTSGGMAVEGGDISSGAKSARPQGYGALLNGGGGGGGGGGRVQAVAVTKGSSSSSSSSLVAKAKEL
ncbi:unnamed protein product [Ectocarpus sp. CCAP 1310/34]|nr:unnamed protein product [Ectocarpus sp. CCAP 1310/34]